MSGKAAAAVRRYTEDSSIAGVQRAARPNVVLRVSWLSVIATGVIVTGISLHRLYSVRMDRPAVVTSRLDDVTAQDFPAVTVCNVNPVVVSALLPSSGSSGKDSDGNLDQVEGRSARQEQQGLRRRREGNGYGYGGGKAGGGEAEDEGRFRRQAGMSYGGYGDMTVHSKEMQALADFLTSYRLSRPGNAWSAEENALVRSEYQTLVDRLTAEEREEVGHQLTHVLSDCLLGDLPCDTRNFTTFYHHKFGNCFTFLPDKSHGKVWRAGSRQGLTVTLLTQSQDYGVADEAGYVVAVHQSRNTAWLEEEGVFVPEGHAGYLALTKTSTKDGVDNDCDGDDVDGQHTTNLYAEASRPGAYSQRACQHGCLQRELFRRCGCCDLDLPCPNTFLRPSPPSGKPAAAAPATARTPRARRQIRPESPEASSDDVIPRCDPTDVIEDICSREVIRSYTEESLPCLKTCVPRCSVTSFNPRFSLTKLLDASTVAAPVQDATTKVTQTRNPPSTATTSSSTSTTSTPRTATSTQTVKPTTSDQTLTTTTGPPSTLSSTQGPSSTGLPPTGPPSTLSSTQGSSSTGLPSTGPPSTLSSTQGPSSTGLPSTGPPSVLSSTQGSSSTALPSTGPPSTISSTQGPSSTGLPPTGPPSTLSSTQGPSSTGLTSTGPPSTVSSTRGSDITPPPTEGSGIPPSPTEGVESFPTPIEGSGIPPSPTEGVESFTKPTEGSGTPPSPTEGVESFTRPTEGSGTPPSPTEGVESVTRPTEGSGTPPSPTEGVESFTRPTAGSGTPPSPTEGVESVTRPTEGSGTPSTPTEGVELFSIPTEGSGFPLEPIVESSLREESARLAEDVGVPLPQTESPGPLPSAGPTTPSADQRLPQLEPNRRRRRQSAPQQIVSAGAGTGAGAESSVRIHVYFQDLRVHVTESVDQSEDWAEWMANIGGVVSLWLGLSVVGVLEVVHVLLELVTVGLSACCGGGASTPIKPFAPPPSGTGLPA